MGTLRTLRTLRSLVAPPSKVTTSTLLVDPASEKAYG